MAFENFGHFSRKFKKQPLSDDATDTLNESIELFGNVNQDKIEKRSFVDWKMIMLAFILLNSTQATEE